MADIFVQSVDLWRSQQQLEVDGGHREHTQEGVFIDFGRWHVNRACCSSEKSLTRSVYVLLVYVSIELPVDLTK